MRELPYWEDKVWGKVWHIFSSPHASLSYLFVNKSSWCSIHKHKERANQFIVKSGAILVERYDPDDFTAPVDEAVLSEGMIHTVPSEVWHRFKVMQSGELLEVYFPDREGAVCRLDDIERFDVGGKQ